MKINEKRIWSVRKPERGSTGLLFSVFLFDTAWFFAGYEAQTSAPYAGSLRCLLANIANTEDDEKLRARCLPADRSHRGSARPLEQACRGAAHRLVFPHPDYSRIFPVNPHREYRSRLQPVCRFGRALEDRAVDCVFGDCAAGSFRSPLEK